MLVVFSSIVRVIIDRSLGFAMILSRTRIIKIMFANPNYLSIITLLFTTFATFYLSNNNIR